MKTIFEMSRKEFYELPFRKSWDSIEYFDSLIILPKKELHESGWRLMDFVAIKDDMPICRLSGCSDVLHIDGISGLLLIDKFDFKKYNNKERSNNHKWSIDCLKKSGLLRIFCDKILTCNPALSDFELIALENIELNNEIT